MNIDFVLLMSAGMGTRMGKIGTQLPKVLWPVFEMSLLELQIAFWRQYRPKIIFINLHFHAELIKKTLASRLSQMNDIVFLEEPILLDSGGPIYNVKKYVDNNSLAGTHLLVANSDQLIFHVRFDSFAATDTTLLAFPVDPLAPYNRLVVKNNVLENIVPPSLGAPDITFAGIGYFNLENCHGPVEVIKFFEGPANFRLKKVQVELLQRPEVWDFGTKEYYFANLKKIMASFASNSAEEMIFFLTSHRAFDVRKAREKDLSYDVVEGQQTGRDVYNFTGSPVALHHFVENVALLAATTCPPTLCSNKLYYQELIDTVDSPRSVGDIS